MLKALARVLFWTYPRGSWQYDAMCLLILVFIFLTPAWVFERSAPTAESTSQEESWRSRSPEENTREEVSESDLEEGEDQLHRLSDSGPS